MRCLSQVEEERAKSIFKIMTRTSENNEYLNKYKHRFPLDVKLYGTYLFLTSGRKSYDDLVANSDSALPSTSSVRQYISQKRNIEEGKLDIEGLATYIRSQDCQAFVVISEDQTKVWSKVKYDPRTGCLVGLVAPYGPNGMPKERFFEVKSASTIYQFFTNNSKASYVNLVMAQPLKDGVAPFCLAAYGTNNKFNYKDCQRRRTYIFNECLKVGIEALVNSGDGDTRILKDMKISSGLGYGNEIEGRPWFKVFYMFLNYIKTSDTVDRTDISLWFSHGHYIMYTVTVRKMVAFKLSVYIYCLEIYKQFEQHFF